MTCPLLQGAFKSVLIIAMQQSKHAAYYTAIFAAFKSADLSNQFLLHQA